MIPRSASRLLVRTGLPAAVALAVLLTGTGVSAAGDAFVPGAAASSSVRIGSPPRHPAGSTVLGPLAAGARLSITVALEPRDPAGLANYATEVATPGSSVYRRYLTVAQFRQRFGPTDAQIGAVEGELRARGLQPEQVSANGLAVKVSATAGAIAHALSLSFQRVQLAGGRVAYANTEAPAFPASVAGTIQAVIGLDSLVRAVPLGIHAPAFAQRGTAQPQVVTGGPQPCSTISGVTSGYTADKLASAYRFSNLYGAGDLGSGQTVALFELEPYSTSDISAYQTCYSTSTSVTNVLVDGGAGTGAGQGEAALDIEDVVGLSPQANIKVYEGPNTNQGVLDTYSKIVTDNVAKVISTSWGLCEPSEGASAAGAENTVFQEAATQGQSVFAAAGDSGSNDCNFHGKNITLTVDDPASQPYVTGVGGTSLTAIGPPPTESVWNGGCSSACAGGGGNSSLWGMPSYQSGAPSGLNVINANSCTTAGRCREVPDVSADANPSTGYVIYWSGAWYIFGGTSAGAPLWAAFTALTNASSACGGSPIGFANPVLYASAAAHYSSDYHDITSGNNNLTGSGLYSAGTAYDMASGLGTPSGAGLPGDLCTLAGTTGNTITVTNPGNQTTTLGNSVSLQIHASDSASGQTLTYSATGLPPALAINTATGLISQTPTTAGVYSVTVTAHDSTSATGSTAFSWTIGKRASSTALSCAPSSFNVGASTTCTATVSDTGSGSPSPVTGTVNFTHSGAGSFGSTSCVLSSGSCQVSYTPSVSGSQTVTASYLGDSFHNGSTSTGFGITAQSTTGNTVTVRNPGNQSTALGAQVSLQIQASDSNTSQTLTYSATGLPAGLSIGTNTGVISGTPTATGTRAVTVTAKDSTNDSGSTTFSWTIKRAAFTALSCTPSSFKVGASTTCTATVSDTSSGTKITPTGTVAFSHSGAGSFSSGSCTLSAGSCHVGYTPSSSGSQTITGSYQGDGSHSASSNAFGITATSTTGNTVTVTNPGNRSTPLGASVNLQIHASDSGGLALTYSATGLPAGLAIGTHTGLISGTPTGTATKSVVVKAKDSTGASGSTAFTWTITPSTNPHPLVKLQVPRQRLGAVRRHGLRLRLFSSQTGGAKLALLLPAKAAKRLGLGTGRHAVVIAAKFVRLEAGKTVRTRLRLHSRARRRLARAKSVRVTLTAVVSGPGGKTHVRRRLLLRG